LAASNCTGSDVLHNHISDDYVKHEAVTGPPQVAHKIAPICGNGYVAHERVY
jgi:hypothetical protein